MTDELSRSGPAVALLVALALLAGGCGQTANTGNEAKDPGKGKAAVAKDDDKEPGEHGAYWCPEHALPEAVCDLCDKKFRAAEKAKGNWCEHNRVKSSCFKCNPGLKEKYAAEYKAKVGKEPPAADDDETKDDGKAKDKK